MATNAEFNRILKPKEISKIISALDSCKHPEQFETWCEWVLRLKIDEVSKKIVLSFVDSKIKSLKMKKYEVLNG
jgi:hypothetical protein